MVERLHQLVTPPELNDALQPPISHGWGEALPGLRDFLKDAASDWKPVAERLAVLTTTSL